MKEDVKNHICKLNTIDVKYRLLFLAVFLRIVFFSVDLFLGATHVDEAMASINAYELAKTGNDLLGTHLPLYFDSWLYGGQSPMAIYLSAAFVKLLGATRFAARLPVLIFSLLSLWAYFEFVYDIFESQRFRIILCSVAVISPWSVFSSAFLLDCNYITFFILFGLCFLAKAIKKENDASATPFFVLSMVFFGLCFYCYMASVLIIPVLLALIYLQLIPKKRISIKNAAVSVVVIAIVSVPFIVFGLVTLGILPRMNFLGFGLTNMQYYSRQNSLSFSEKGSFLKNFLTYILLLFGVDFTIISEGIGKFQYSNLFGGLFVGFEIVLFLASLFKKKKYNNVQNAFMLSFLLSSFIYCLLVGEAYINFLYRLAPIEFFLLFFEGSGIAELSLLLKKLITKKETGKRILAAYMAASVLLFTVSYTFLYRPQIKNSFLFMYGDTYYETVEEVKKLGFSDYTIYCDSNYYNNHLSVFSRYYYNDKEFIDYKDEVLKNHDGIVTESITTDGSINFSTDSKLSAPCCIYPVQLADRIDKDGYDIIDIYEWEIAYKK